MKIHSGLDILRRLFISVHDMYVSVAPAARLPRGLIEFTYAIPDGMPTPPGSLVMIDFHGRRVSGIVMVEEQTSSLQRIKSIDRVIGASLWGTKELVAMRNVARGMLTTLPRLFFYLIPRAPAHWPLIQGGVPRPQKKFSTNLFRSFDDDTTFTHLAGKIAKTLKNKKSALVVVARQQACEDAVRRLRTLLPRVSIQCYSTERTGSEGFGAWLSLATGGQVLVTTRAGIFAPAKNLGLMIILHEELDDFKDWGHDPYVDARVVAEARARALGISLLVASRAPRVQTWRRFSGPSTKKQLLTIVNNHYPTQIIDLNIAGGTRESRILTEPLERAIQESLNAKKHVVLLASRRGEGGMMLCRDCQRPLLCPRCSGPLVSHGPHLECHRCESREIMPLFCLSCKSPHLTSFGWGTLRLVPLLRERFKDARVVRVDRDTGALPPLDAPSIIVGTTRLLTDARPVIESSKIRIGLLGILFGDALLDSNDFRAEERAYATMREFGSLGAPMIVQTYSPRHRVFAALVGHLDHALYESWIKERKNWLYPPFVQLISLTRVGSHDTIAALIEHEWEVIKGKLPEGVEITSLVAWPYATRGAKRWTALVKVPLGQPLPPLFLHLSSSWHIEVNPQRLFSI